MYVFTRLKRLFLNWNCTVINIQKLNKSLKLIGWESNDHSEEIWPTFNGRWIVHYHVHKSTSFVAVKNPANPFVITIPHFIRIILLLSCSNLHLDFTVAKKNQLDVTFCILYFSSNSCSTFFGQPCAHHQELTTAWCYRLVLVCAVAAGRWSSPVGR